MLKPFYQGKLDTFCAIYAVLNALRLTHGLRVLKARDILNETLMGLAATPQAFRAVLEQETDYCALVDGMLRVQRRSFPLEIRQPFAVTDDPAPAQLWECCRDWLNPADHRAVIFRFTRHLTADGRRSTATGPRQTAWKATPYTSLTAAMRPKPSSTSTLRISSPAPRT